MFLFWMLAISGIALTMVFTDGLLPALAFFGTCFIPMIAVGGARWGIARGDSQQKVGVPFVALLLLAFAYWLSRSVMIHLWGFGVSGLMLLIVACLIGFTVPLAWGDSPNET